LIVSYLLKSCQVLLLVLSLFFLSFLEAP
jgi:hypothetical protein